MRVVFVLPGPALRPGGGHKVVYQYASALAEAGADVWVMHLRTAKPKDADATWARQAVRQLSYGVGRFWRPRWFPLAAGVHVRNFPSQRGERLPRDVDVLVATSVGTAEFVARECQRLQARGVYLIQHFEDYSHDADYVLHTWSLPLERVVVSGWLRDRASAEGLTATLIRNGVDPEEFPPGPEPEARGPSVAALVSAQAWKRTDLVAAVYERLERTVPGVRLHAFGTCPRPQALPPATTYLEDPPRDVLAALYRDVAVYLCASDYEGFGLPVLEAMASGAAVVSTDNGGVTDFAGEHLELVPPGDVDGMVRGVETLLLDLAARRTNVESGRGIAESMDLGQAQAQFVDFCVGSDR